MEYWENGEQTQSARTRRNLVFSVLFIFALAFSLPVSEIDFGQGNQGAKFNQISSKQTSSNLAATRPLFIRERRKGQGIKNKPPALPSDPIQLPNANVAVVAEPVSIRTPSSASAGTAMPHVMVSALERLFGKKIEYSVDSKSDVPLPIYVNGRFLGTELVQVVPKPGLGIEKLYTFSLTTDLERVLKTEKHDEIKGALEGQKFVTPETLETLGYHVKYETTDSSVLIEVAEEFLTPINVNASDFHGSKLAPNTKEDFISGYLNIHASEVFGQSQAASGRTTPFGASLDGTISTHGVSVLGGGNVYNDQFKRTQTALVAPWDLGREQVWVGDTRFSNTSALSYPELSGISWFHKPHPSNQHKDIDGGVVMTKNRTTLQIFKNEVLYKIIEIGPGAFQISDIPLDLGQNVVRLVMRDQVTGQITDKTITDFLPIYSVPEGSFESAISYGSHRNEDYLGINYFGRPAAYAGAMYGLNKLVNLGGSLYSAGAYIEESEAIRYFQNEGNFAFSVSQSETPHARGGAATLEYLRSLVPISGVASISFSETVTSGGYYVNEFDTNGQPSRLTTLNIGLKPIKGVSLSFGGVDIVDRTSSRDRIFATLTKTYRFSKRWGLKFSAGDSHATDGGDQGHFAIELSYSPYLEEGVLTNLATVTESMRGVSTTYDDQRGLNLSAATAQYNGSESVETRLQATQTYIHGDIGASVAQSAGLSTQEFDLNTALVFTNHGFAISEPLQSSFVLIQSKNDRGILFDVSDSNGTRIANSGSFLRSVAVSVPDWYNSEHSAAFLDSEYYTLESSKTIVFESRFRTGTTVSLQSESRAIVSGTLIDEDGKKLKATFLKFVCSKPDDLLTDVGLSDQNGEFQFQVKRFADCHIEAKGKGSPSLDLSWPVKYKDLGDVLMK